MLSDNIPYVWQRNVLVRSLSSHCTFQPSLRLYYPQIELGEWGPLGLQIFPRFVE